MTIIVNGAVQETLEDGAVVRFLYKLGLVNVFWKQYDLCKDLNLRESSNLTCPVAKGEISVKYTFEIPNPVSVSLPPIKVSL